MGKGEKNRRVCSTNSYRLWLYICNALLLVVIGAFAVVTHAALNEPKMKLIPLDKDEPLVISVYVLLFLQVVDVAFCFVGLWRNKVRLLFVYWALLLILLALDFLSALLWVFRWRTLHVNVMDHVTLLLNECRDNTVLCNVWNSVQNEYSCCGALGYSDFREMPQWCGEILGNFSRLPKSCCGGVDAVVTFCNLTDFAAVAPPPKGCYPHLLHWMHDKGGNVLLMGFCFVIFAKIVLLIISRSEIRELTYEVDAAHHRVTISAVRAFSVDRSPYSDEDDAAPFAPRKSHRDRAPTP